LDYISDTESLITQADEPQYTVIHQSANISAATKDPIPNTDRQTNNSTGNPTLPSTGNSFTENEFADAT
jgi:hypothetical protein